MQYGNVMKPAYLETEDEQLLVDVLAKFYTKYNRAPDLDEIEVVIEKLKSKNNETLIEETLDLANHIYKYVDTWDLEFAKDEALTFIKQQAHRIHVLKCVDYIEDQRFDKIEESLRETMLVGANLQDVGIFLKGDVEEWAKSIALEEKIPTGIYHLDEILDGGIARKELCYILGPTNRGKSQLLINIAHGAAGFVSRSNVCYITLELAADKTAKRLGARTVGKWLKRGDDIREYIRIFEKEVAGMIAGDINVKEFPAGSIGVADIDNHLDLLELIGFKTDLLIVDSADDLKKRYGQGDYEGHGEIYTLLRGIAQERNIAVVTSSQGTRGSLSADTVEMEHTGDSIKKPQRVDIGISISQTRAEKFKDQMRLYLMKFRDGEPERYIGCQVDRESHSIISTGILDPREMHKQLRALKREYTAEQEDD